MTKVAEDKLSYKNIKSIEIVKKEGSISYTFKLDSLQIKKFSQLAAKRKDGYIEINDSFIYQVTIEVYGRGNLTYSSDGLHFTGQDDSSDIPFSFTLPESLTTFSNQ